MCCAVPPPPQARKGNRTETFYTMPEYEAWRENLGTAAAGWDIKYYKGLEAGFVRSGMWSRL